MTEYLNDDQIQKSISIVKEILTATSAAKSMADMYSTVTQASGLTFSNCASHQHLLNTLSVPIIAACTREILTSGAVGKGKRPSPSDQLEILRKLLEILQDPAQKNSTPDSEPTVQDSPPAAEPENHKS